MRVASAPGLHRVRALLRRRAAVRCHGRKQVRVVVLRRVHACRDRPHPSSARPGTGAAGTRVRLDPEPAVVIRRPEKGLTPPPADNLFWIIGPPTRLSFPKLLRADQDIEEAVRLYRERYGAGGLFGRFASSSKRKFIHISTRPTTGIARKSFAPPSRERAAVRLPGPVVDWISGKRSSPMSRSVARSRARLRTGWAAGAAMGSLLT